MFDSPETEWECRAILAHQELVARSLRSWLFSYEEAKLDKFARLMEERKDQKPFIRNGFRGNI